MADDADAVAAETAEPADDGRVLAVLAIAGEGDGTADSGAKGGPGGVIPAAAGGTPTPWSGGAAGGMVNGDGSGSEGAARAGGSVPWSPRRNSGITAFRPAIA